MLELLMVMFSSPSLPAPQQAPPPPAAVPTAEETEAARLKEAGIQRRRKGRRSTILTSGLGDTSTAPVERKTLLGQ